MKLFKAFLVFALSLLVLAGFWGSAKAVDIRSKQTVTINKDDQITDEMLVAAGEINVNGIINNDLIGAASQVTISGKVDGNVNIGGGTINLTGEVTEDARFVGGTIKVTGKVGQNLIVVGGSIEITDTAEIAGDVIAYGGTLKIYGNIKGDLRYSGGSILVSGTIDSNVKINSPEITIGSPAYIKGDLDYTSTNAATIQNGAKIDGRSTYRLSQKQDYFAQKSVVSLVVSGIAYIILALIFIILLPSRVITISETLKNNCWASGLVGLLSIVIIPIIVLLLLVTIVGAPSAVGVLVLYLFAIYLAKIFVAEQIGRIILNFIDKKNEPNVILSTVIGLIIVLVAINLPYIGYPVSLAVNIFGVGAIVIYLYNLRKTAKAFKLI